MTRLLVIALGGGIGTALRYATALAAIEWFGDQFPYGTLAVNLAGAFAIGLIQEVAVRAAVIPEDLRLFLTTGIMGGMTTYSTFSFETVRLMQVGAWHRAWLNVVITTAACLALCFLGIAVARLAFPDRG